MWVHVEFHQTTNFWLTRLTVVAVNDLCFKLKTLEVDVLSQNCELMVLLAWHGLKMEILCSIQYQMIIKDLTGKVTVLDPFSQGSRYYLISFFFGRVLCRNLGFDDMDDVPVFTESDPSFCVDITSTKDGKFITVNSNSRTSSEEGTCIFYFPFPFPF